MEIDGVNSNNICPLGTGIVAFFVSLVVLCYKVQWGRGMMAFCVSLVELKVSSFKENKNSFLSVRERLIQC